MTTHNHFIGGNGPRERVRIPAAKVKMYPVTVVCDCGYEIDTTFNPGQSESWLICPACDCTIHAVVKMQLDGHGTIETVTA